MCAVKYNRADMQTAYRVPAWLRAGFAQLSCNFDSVCNSIGNWLDSKSIRSLGLAAGALAAGALSVLGYSDAAAQTGIQKPVVSISAVEESATEGAAILFSISATPRPDREISLEFDAELSGDFGVVFNPNAVLTPENPTAFVVVLTKDDKRAESDGSVALTIKNNQGTSDYEVAAFPENTASVKILDNDWVGENLATVSVKAEADFVEEGATARFVFYSSKTVNEPLVVNVAQEGNFIDEYYDCYTIEMVRGETTASLNIITVDDRFFENNGRITVSLEPSRHYKLAKSNRTASVVVVDNDHEERFTQNLTKSLANSSEVVPEISIESVNAGPLAEGEFGEFRISASEAPTKDLPIIVSVYELNSDIYKGREIKQMDIPAFADSLPFALETSEDNVKGGDGKIILTVLPGTGYTVGGGSQISVQTSDSGNGSAPLAAESSIAPAHLPEISISNTGRQSISEGQIASFQIEASSPPDIDLEVNLFVSDGEGEFLDSGRSNSLTFPSGQRLVHLDLPTVNDEVVEPDGSIVVALMSGQGYQLGASIGGFVEVLDNDKTSVNNSVFGCGSKIDAVADGPVPVIEIDTVPFSQIGSITQFRIQASVTVETDMTVNLDLSGGDATGELNFAISVPLLKGEQVTTFFFPTDEYGATSSSNELSARVTGDSNYIVSDTKEAATTQLVQHGSNTPVIAIEAITGSITEGENAEFLLESTEVVPNQMEVLIEFRERKGGWNYDTFIETVLFPRGSRTLPVILSTEIDDEFYGDGEIVATVLTGQKYLSAKTPENTARVLIRNDGVPVIDVKSLQLSGDEGSRFGFEFSANPVPKSQLTVTLQVNQTGNFLANATGSEELSPGRSTLVFSPNTGTMRRYAQTESDSELEADGSIEVFVLPGAGYRSSLSSEIARVTVFDNDAPRLSLTSLSNAPRTEGEHLEFEIQASRAVHTNLQVNLEISEDESNYAVETTSTRTLPTQGEKVTFTVPTVDDDVDEEDNLVTVSLLPGAGYNVASAAYYASVQVADNDDPRQISIESASDTVYEGEPAVFFVQASENTRREIGIYVDGGRGNFLIDTPPSSIFVEGNSPVVLNIPTEDDEVDESDEFIIVNILPGEGYFVTPETSSAAVQVLDNDTPPLITIESGLDEIFEGDSATFVITSTNPANRTVNVGISDGGSGILAESDQTLRIDLAGRTSQLVTVSTIDNELYQPNGNIAAIVLSGENYTVAEHPNNIASINVLDNDTASAYSIEAVKRVVEEGSTIRFKIESRGLAGVVAPIEVVRVGDFVRGQPPASVRLKQRGLTYFEIATDNDSHNEENGSVTVSLNLSGENISVLGGRNRATVEILDNDIPEISLRSSQSFVELHKGISFTAVSSIPIASSLKLRLKISDIGETFEQEKFVNITLPAGQTVSNKAAYIVPRTDVFQFNRRIVAELVSSPSYKIKRGNGKSDVRVVGVETPEISIESISDDRKNEGSAFDFRLNSSIAMSRPLKVKVEITSEGGFLAADQERIIVLDASESQVEFQVQSVYNSGSEGNGSITVAVQDGPGYVLSTDNSVRSATVAVLNRELSMVSIQAAAQQVTEGEPIQLELSSNMQSGSDMEITVEVTASDNIIDSNNLGNHSHTLNAGQRTLSFSIATLENQVYTPNLNVRVAIQNGAGYQVSQTNGSVTVTVTDNDLPVLSIAAVDDTVNEGSPARFVISSSNASTSALSVRYSVTQNGYVLQDTTRIRTVQLRSNSKTTTIEVATSQDSVDEVNGTITATLEVGSSPAQYGIAANNAGIATVVVLDDDLPVIIISARSTEVLEGETIQLTISTASAISLASDLNINIFVSRDDNYINSADAGRKTVTISANNRFVTHRIATLENQQINDNGKITVEVQAGEGYLIAGAPDNSSSIAILDDDLFEMSITALAATKNEGERVGFVITSTNSPDSPIILNIQVTEPSTHPETGEITSVTTGLLQVFPSGQKRLEFSRDTTHDGVHGTDTLMTLEIKDGNGYEISSNNYRATTTVKNIDIPEISIRPITFSTNPGQERMDYNNITLTSTIELNVPLNVEFEVAVTDSSTGTTSDSQFTHVVEPVSSPPYQISIGNRYSAQAGDSVAITLQSGTGYDVSATEQQVSFTIPSTGPALLTNSLAPEPIRTPTVHQNVSRQEVNLPILSIAADSRAVSEGGKARFRISATRASTEDLTVNLAVGRTGVEFIGGTPPETVILGAGKTIAVLDIDIIDDNVKQSDRVLSVSIEDGENYLLAESPNENDVVTISDNERVNRSNRIQNLNMEIVENSLSSLGTAFADSLLLRINQAFNNEISETPSFSMGGDNTILDVLQYQTQKLGDSTNTWASLLEESSLHYTMFSDSELVMPITVWGNSDYYFKTEDNDDDSMNEDGEVYNVFMGFDAHHRTGIVGGAAVNQFVSDLDYRAGADESIQGKHQIQLTGVHPYLGWVSQLRNMRVWSSAGFGQGNVLVEELENENESLPSTYRMFSINSENQFLNLEDGFGGNADIELRNEAWSVQQGIDGSSIGLDDDSSYDAYRFRSALHGDHQLVLSEETSLHTKITTGLHWQGGTSGDYFRFEVGSDFSSEIPYGFSVYGHSLLLFGSSVTFEEQALNGGLNYDDEHDGLGIIVDVSSSVGDSKQGNENASEFWRINFADNSWNSATPWEDKQFEVKFAYGLQVFDENGVLTPYNRIVLRNQGRHEFRMGHDMTVGTNFSTSLEGFVSLLEEENDLGVSSRYNYSW